MASADDNLLLRLHKWAWRQDENFLTEAFAHLLQHLLSHEPEAAVGLLHSLTRGFLDLCPAEARSVEVRTQVFTAEGTPDLQLRTSKQTALLEVKCESDADPGLSRLKSWSHKDLFKVALIPSCGETFGCYPATIAGFLFQQ